jgi:hypothetical protein
MSLLKIIKAQLGLSGTPANNFTLDASADNGTMRLARGNAGATTQDIMLVAADGKVTFPQTPAVEGIRGFFQAKTEADQNFTSATLIKVSLTEIVDQDGWFSGSPSNHRYTPQIAGYYQFVANLWMSASGNITEHSAFFYKNGANTYLGAQLREALGSGKIVSISAVIYLNGTTDYVELFAAITGTSPQILAAATYFSGSLLKAD